MDRNEKLLKTVFKERLDIEALLKESIKSKQAVNSLKAMVHLSHLSLINMTWDILEKTKIGYSVNDLRKACSSANVTERAKRLLRKWKGLQPSGMKDDVNKSGANGEINTTPAGDVSDISTNSNVSPIKSPGHDLPPRYEEAQWTVRFASEDEMGLRLIFARRGQDAESKFNINKDMMKTATTALSV